MRKKDIAKQIEEIANLKTKKISLQFLSKKQYENLKKLRRVKNPTLVRKYAHRIIRSVERSTKTSPLNREIVRSYVSTLAINKNVKSASKKLIKQPVERMRAALSLEHISIKSPKITLKKYIKGAINKNAGLSKEYAQLESNQRKNVYKLITKYGINLTEDEERLMEYIRSGESESKIRSFYEKGKHQKSIRFEEMDEAFAYLHGSNKEGAVKDLGFDIFKEISRIVGFFL